MIRHFYCKQCYNHWTTNDEKVHIHDTKCPDCMSIFTDNDIELINESEYTELEENGHLGAFICE